MPLETDEGFVVLVHIPVGSGLPYQDTYIVGCSTHEEAEAKIKNLYPSEPNIRLYAPSNLAGSRRCLSQTIQPLLPILT